MTSVSFSDVKSWWNTLYSFCAKTPFPLDIVHESVFLKGFVIGAVVCHLAELGIYVAILIKQTKIEAGASSVYIVKNNQSVSTRKACKAQRRKEQNS